MGVSWPLSDSLAAARACSLGMFSLFLFMAGLDSPALAVELVPRIMLFFGVGPPWGLALRHSAFGVLFFASDQSAALPEHFRRLAAGTCKLRFHPLSLLDASAKSQ